uniref:Uncharacterized protein n=1 Tax=Rhizophora mucronata TaxID=61149 RepID=A0A2P2N0M6_RHIMU
MALSSNVLSPPPPLPSCLLTTSDGDSSSSSCCSISAVHPDILLAHILPRLDGPTLAAAACATTELNLLASHEDLWTELCRSTWPSTEEQRLRQIISTFPDGPRSFFYDSFPLLSNMDPTAASIRCPADPNRPSELVSAVDIYYRNKLIFTKVLETETLSAWFRYSPFRIDMLDPKDTCPTPIQQPQTEEGCRQVAEELTLSWILIDPGVPRAMNLSSHRPVLVQRHWLSGEVHARFEAIVGGGERGSSSEKVGFGMVVTCGGGAQGRGMHVREVSLQAEDMDGMISNGKDSLGILERAFEGKKGIRGRSGEEGKRRHHMFQEMKRERKERKLRREDTLDMLCVAFGVLSLLVSLGVFFLHR